MHRNEWRMALRTVPFLEEHANDPVGLLQLRAHPNPRFLVWDPAALESIFHQDRQLRHAASRTLLPVLGQHSLLWTDGARHLAYRHVLAPLLRGRRYRDLVADVVHSALDNCRPGTAVSLPDWTRTITLRIIARITFGEVDDPLLARFTGWLDRALGWRPRTLAYRYLRGGLPRSGETLDGLLVHAARAAAGMEPTATQPTTLSAALLSGRAPLGELDDAELRDQIVSLLFAGHETTASAAAWALCWLHRHDNIRHDVIAELEDTGSDGFAAAEAPLLHAVAQETLRLSPPAPVASNRVIPPGVTLPLLDHSLPCGTVLTPSIYLAHHDPKHFGQPERFDPHRFLDRPMPGHQWLPFGGGTRSCLGADLAMTEIRMIVAAVLRARGIRVVNAPAAVPSMRGHAMAPSGQLRMVIA